MNIMVTGCAGFIGSHACEELLNRGHVVYGIDSMSYAADPFKIERLKKFGNFHFYECHINDDNRVKSIVDLSKITHIINFAAETHVDNSIKCADPFIYSNIVGVTKLLEVTRQTNVELIHISTDEVYGPALNDTTYNEFSNLNPKNPYAASKAAADLIIQAYKNTHNVKAKIVRPCNNFGPGQHGEKFIPTILRSIKSGKKIPVYGNGCQSREWMFVKDTAKIVSDLVEQAVEFDVLNITTSNELMNLDVIKTVLNIMKKDYDECIEHVTDRPGHDVRYSISTEKMNNLLSIEFTSFDKAIELTINSYEE